MPRGGRTGKTTSAPKVGSHTRAGGQARSEDQCRDSTTPNARLGPSNGNWRGGERVTHHGYRMTYVGVEHPLSDAKGYAYTHLLVWVAAGNEPPGPGEELHHCDGRKTYNRLSNLEMKTAAEHSRLHLVGRERDERGRFLAAEREAATA